MEFGKGDVKDVVNAFAVASVGNQDVRGLGVDGFDFGEEVFDVGGEGDVAFVGGEVEPGAVGAVRTDFLDECIDRVFIFRVGQGEMAAVGSEFTGTCCANAIARNPVRIRPYTAVVDRMTSYRIEDHTHPKLLSRELIAP